MSSDRSSSGPSAVPVAASDLAPPDFFDPVVEAYKKDLDQTLLRENLKLTPAERMIKFERNMRMVFELRRAARKRLEQSGREHE